MPETKKLWSGKEPCSNDTEYKMRYEYKLKGRNDKKKRIHAWKKFEFGPGKVKDVIVEEVTDTTATLSWSPESCAEQYQVVLERTRKFRT